MGKVGEMSWERLVGAKLPRALRFPEQTLDLSVRTVDLYKQPRRKFSCLLRRLLQLLYGGLIRGEG